MRVNNARDLATVDLFVPDHPITVTIGDCDVPLTFDRKTPMPVDIFRGHFFNIKVLRGKLQGTGETLSTHARYSFSNQKVGPACDNKLWIIDPTVEQSIQVLSFEEFSRRLFNNKTIGHQ